MKEDQLYSEEAMFAINQLKFKLKKVETKFDIAIEGLRAINECSESSIAQKTLNEIDEIDS